MKKTLALLMTLVLCLTLATMVQAQSTYTPGTYTSETTGRNGPIVVSVTFDENNIVDAQVISHAETAHIGTEAIERIPAGMVETQKIPDIISGATQTSAVLRLALADCVDQAGGDSKALLVPDEPKPIKAAVEECNVVVVGGGGSGINAAIEMGNRGLHVILLEKEDILGGTSITASTSLCGFGTPQQIEAGFGVTVDEYYEDMTQITYVSKRFKEADPDIAYRLAESFPVYAQQLMEWGVDLGNARNAFSLMPSDGSTIGSTLFPALIDQLEPAGVDVRTGNKAISIIADDSGAAKGVVVECDAGIYEIHARKVLMTFGGYIANNDIVAKYTPQYDGWKTTWSVGSTGEGLQMCIDMGGYLGGMDSITINPACYPIPGANLISFTPLRTYGSILVDIYEGKRFANEIGDYTFISEHMPDGKAYILFDQQVYDACATIREYDGYGYFTKGETVEELAEKLGLDSAVLSETVSRYSGFAVNGVDEDWQRATMPSDLSVGPYYATLVEPALHSCPGGVVTNARGQALREDGSIIENLYVSGHAADNTLQPRSLCGAVYFSRLVGELIAEDLGC
ncbi:MAG: FAD-dependent oxidoreductase [Clostridiales bacterium]|nr:FAD-dependent oxidoreductase [Bacillota bacterium]NLL54507.1 FAD-dependent oxidoreductase [Clostridiales bacterium]